MKHILIQIYNKYIKYTIVLSISYLSINYATAQELNAESFISNMKQKIYQLSEYQDYYFDLNKKSIIQMKSYDNNEPIEEIVGYNAVVREGSFLNKNKKEYLLQIIWNWPSYFGHSDNFGPLNHFIVFDNKFNQLSDVYYQDATSEFKEIIDICNDGLNELIMESGYCGQGFSENFTSVFYKNFTAPILHYVSRMECLNDFAKEFDEGETIYKIEENKFIINITKNSFIRLSTTDKRKISEENCSRTYLFRNGKMFLINGRECELQGY